MGFGSTSSSRRPRRGAILSLGIDAQATKINTLMCSDNADDRAAPPVSALILVIVPQSGESELGGHRLPLRLKIIALMMRKADSACVKIDVQHLSRPRSGHHVGGRRRLIGQWNHPCRQRET